MTAADQIAEIRRKCAARYAAINRGRFARKRRPRGRGWRFNSTMPRDGRQDMWRVLTLVQRTPDEKRCFWMQAKPKMVVSNYMLDRGKIRVWPELPAFVSRRNDVNGDTVNMTRSTCR